VSRKHDAAALDAAWRIHDAQMEWTGRVDTKATFAFGIEAALVAAIAALSASPGALRVIGWFQLFFWLGLLLLAVGAYLSAMVVAPILRSRNLANEARRDHIYFGHVRHLTPEQFEQRIRRADLLPVLSRQIVRVAGLNWVKHRRVQTSIWFGVTGGALVTFSILLPHVAASA
jgi:hypothetical protein